MRGLVGLSVQPPMEQTVTFNDPFTAGAYLMLLCFAPDPGALWRMAEEEGVTVFGASAKYISALEKAGERPGEDRDLHQLRAILSTGSPLAPEAFDYVYRHIKADVQLSSISGGTDIVSCFALGCPILPVHRGELQCRGLGMAVEIWDEDGRPVVGRKGELVCTRPFPCMPVGFWNDPEGTKYHDAYFARFDGVWCHGDYAELTPAGGLVIYGRSDAVLNPGGVRIGTAEIYRQVEKLDDIVESSLQRAGLWNEVFHPCEPPIPSNSPIRQIHVHYPHRQLFVAGMDVPWVVVFLVLTMICGLVIGKLMKVSF